MKNLAEQQTAFIPNVQLCIGVVACVGLLLGALIAAAYLLNLTVTLLCEIADHIATLYQHSDPAMQLLMLFIVGYCIFKAARSVYLRRKKEAV